MTYPGKPEIERAAGAITDPDKPEVERASGAMTDPDKSELERALGGLEPVSTARQVCERYGDKIEISGCGVVNIMMNQEPNGILPNFMMQYQKDFLNLFVPTVPFPVCEKTLRKHHVLMISGAPGSGKTMIAQQLMVKLYDVNKCHPFRVTKPSEYTKKHNPNILQVFHIDDVFGSSNFVKGTYDAWVSVFGDMSNDLRSNNTFIIFTSRDNILNGIDVDNYEVLKHVINLSDQKFKLSNENKIDIFDNHAKANQLGIAYNDIVHHIQVEMASDRTTQDPMGYPQRVRLLCAMKDATKETRIRYFRHPMEFLSSVISSYRKMDHLSYCILIMLLMHDGKLPVSYLRSSNKSSEQVQTCFDICDLSASTTMGALRTTANNLCGSFLLITDGFFVFQHESIMEAATLDFGQFYPSDILDRCTIQFLLERAFTKDSAPRENVYVVILQSDTYSQLCLRLVKEIQQCVCVEGKASSDKGDLGSLSSLSNYRVFQDPAFLCVFLLHLKDTASFHLLITSSSPDSQHPTFLFFAAASGQDMLIQEILSSYLVDVQQLPGFSDHLVHVLYAACSGGSPATVRKLLATGARADYMMARTPYQVRHNRGWNQPLTCTTLMHAAYSGNVEVLRLVLDHLQQHQVDVTEHITIRGGYWGRMALHWWAVGGRGAAGPLQILLEAGADLHARDKDGRTAFHVSARRGHESSIRTLVVAGADVNVVDKDGQTALHLGTMHEASIRALVKAGADLQMRDKDGRTALHLSAIRDHEVSIHALLEARADVNVVDKFGMTALHFSAPWGNDASIRALVNAGANVNMVDKDGRTALHLSARWGRKASIHALLKAGADLQTRDIDGRIALHLSAIWGHKASIRALVVAGTDVNVVDKDGRTALHLSTLHEASIHALVAARADVNMVDKNDQTALHLSAKQGHKASICALVMAGADVNVVDKDGRTALHLSTMHEASIRVLVVAGADVNVEDKDGLTALHLSAMRGHKASIRAFVETGADVNVRDKDGRTALHLSALLDCVVSIHALLEIGADVNVVDKDGRTALFHSARQGNEASIRALVKAGADVNVVDKDGQTALHQIAWLVEAGLGRADTCRLKLLFDRGSTPLLPTSSSVTCHSPGWGRRPGDVCVLRRTRRQARCVIL